MPFTQSEFFEVFAEYNAAVWPMQFVLLGLAIITIGLVLTRPITSRRTVPAILAFLWAWMAIAYHFMQFAAINPAATAFAVMYLIEAALLLWAGTIAGRVRFGPTPMGRQLVGWLLIIYGLLIYPIIGRLAGHIYMASPTFGVPCPTTIFTVGILFFSSRFPKYLLVIPIIWAAIGTSAAVNLGVPQDFGLAVAGIAAFALVFLRQREQSAAPTPPSPRP